MAEDYSSKDAQRAAMVRATTPLTYKMGQAPVFIQPLHDADMAGLRGGAKDQWMYNRSVKEQRDRQERAYPGSDKENYRRQGYSVSKSGAPTFDFNNAVRKLNPDESPFRDTSWQSPQDALQNLADNTPLPDKQYLPQMGAADREEQYRAQDKRQADLLAAWEKEWQDTHRYAKDKKEQKWKSPEPLAPPTALEKYYRR
jgi:hypothetical protein